MLDRAAAVVEAVQVTLAPIDLPARRGDPEQRALVGPRHGPDAEDRGTVVGQVPDLEVGVGKRLPEALHHQAVTLRAHPDDPHREAGQTPLRGPPMTWSVSPPVALTLHIAARILAEIGRTDDEDLEALRPSLVASPRTGRDAHHVPLLDLDDLVVELHPPAPEHDHVDLLLLLVRVAVREAIAGRDALTSSRSSVRFFSVNGTAAILLFGLRPAGPGDPAERRGFLTAPQGHGLSDVSR